MPSNPGWELFSPNVHLRTKVPLPCAFFSRRLTFAERNYDVCNRELLAARLALEECSHLLEGAKSVFVVWMEKGKPEFLRSAKLLNAANLPPSCLPVYP